MVGVAAPEGLSPAQLMGQDNPGGGSVFSLRVNFHDMRVSRCGRLPPAPILFLEGVVEIPYLQPVVSRSAK